MDELKYTIAEASEMLDNVSYRTLHYYERKIGIKINRDGSGNRIYSEDDINIFEKIIELKKKGMTLDGIKALFQEKGIIQPEDNNIVVIDEKAFEMKELLLNEIKKVVSQQIRDDLKDANNKLEQLIEENKELKEEIQKIHSENNEHYIKIDQQLTKWRENKSNNRPWYKKIFK